MALNSTKPALLLLFKGFTFAAFSAQPLGPMQFYPNLKLFSLFMHFFCTLAL